MSYALLAPQYGFGEVPPLSEPLPTKAEVKSDLAPYIDIANQVSPPSGFDPLEPDTWTPDRMIPYGINQAMALQKHLGLAAVDLGKVTEMVKGQIKWLDEMGVPLTSIPTNVRDLCLSFAKLTAVVVCKQFGIPPEFGTMTVDVLSDGEFTSEDLEAIGALAGGMAGSAVCGMLFLPPQLGGYIGSFVGKLVGTLVASFFGIGGGSAERAQRRAELEKLRRAVKKQLNSIRGQYQSMVLPPVRQIYWALFDRMLADLENLWEKNECLTGVEGVLPPVRFPLIWGASGLALSPTERPFLRHPFVDASRCRPPNYALQRSPDLCLDQRFIVPGTVRGCPSMTGCPYPSFPQIGAGGAERVAQAFAAHNVWWTQPQNRAANTEAWKQALPEPPSRIVNFIARRTQERQGCKSNECKRYADRDINNAVGEYNQMLGGAIELAGPSHMLGIGMRIQADIIASGSIYAAATAVRAEQNAIRTKNTVRIKKIMGRIGDPAYVASLQRNEKISRVYGAVTNGVLNYGLPALGAVMLGAALWRKK